MYLKPLVLYKGAKKHDGQDIKQYDRHVITFLRVLLLQPLQHRRLSNKILTLPCDK